MTLIVQGNIKRDPVPLSIALDDPSSFSADLVPLAIAISLRFGRRESFLLSIFSSLSRPVVCIPVHRIGFSLQGLSDR
ncbi:hypothetical protein GOP47_0024874 [Adiantum capillus-veneris]|uniref:Uncharacterized protein n=1 Tax=Adiantum capillus-veneris TaxID=13818 RepID=A0A9D4U2K8_ADICA|nr:hypothetical protein GOP47_0024874 [Adiantum capillus-veneris]